MKTFQIILLIGSVMFCYSAVHFAIFWAVFQKAMRQTDKGFYYWASRINNSLRQVNTYEQLCSCEEMITAFKNKYQHNRKAMKEWKSLQLLFIIKREFINKTTALVPVDLGYTQE